MTTNLSAKKKIVLIRAGKTESGEKELYLGWKDEEILDSEIERIKLRTDLGIYPKASRVYTSPLLRCRNTSYIIYKGVPAIVSNGFGPFDFGPLEGKNDCSIELENENGIDKIAKGEIIYSFTTQVHRAFNELVDEIKNTSIETVAVITHEKVIKAIIRNYVVPRSIQHIIAVDYGGGLLLEHDLNTNSSTIVNMF